MVFVRYLDTNDYMEQLWFAVHLPKIPQESKYLRKWFCSLKNISFNGLIVCVFARMALRPWWDVKRASWVLWKRKIKIFQLFIVLSIEKIWQQKRYKETQQVVSVINFIKSRPLHTRLFRVMWDEMEAEHNRLLFHSNIRWFSQGKVLERVANLRNKICTFLKEQKHEFVDRFSDDK